MRTISQSMKKLRNHLKSIDYVGAKLVHIDFIMV